MPIRLRAKSRNFGAGHAINKGTIHVQIPCLATNRIPPQTNPRCALAACHCHRTERDRLRLPDQNDLSQAPQFFELYAVIAGREPTLFAKMQEPPNTGKCAEQGQTRANVW